MATTSMPYTDGPAQSAGLVCLTKALKPEKHVEAKAIDIVAVHGLSAEPGVNIWQAVDGTLWLRDLIPKDIKGARVFAFHYNAQPLYAGQQDSLESTASTLLSAIAAARQDIPSTRPLVFICHGLGGLLVESALNYALTNPSAYPAIEVAVKVVVFLSCPQRPSEVPWPSILIRCAVDGVNTGRPVSETTYRGVLDWLNQQAQHLESIPKDFKKNASRHKIKVVSCYEQIPTASQPQCSLDEYTGALGLKTEKVQMMGGCDHHSLAAFSSKEGANYKFIVSAIKKARKAAANASEPAPPAAPGVPRDMQNTEPVLPPGPPHPVPLPLPQAAPSLAMPTPLFAGGTSTHSTPSNGQSAPQGPGSIFTQSTSRHSVSPVTPISPTYSIDPSKMKIARRPVGLPPSKRSSPGGTPVAASIRSLSSASNHSGHASVNAQPLHRPGPLRSVSQSSVMPPSNMPAHASTRSLSDTSPIPSQLQPTSNQLTHHFSHQSLPGQIVEDPAQGIVPLRRQSRVKSIKSIDGLPEGVVVQARRQTLETRAPPPDVQRGIELPQNHAHHPFSGATQRPPGPIPNPPLAIQQNTAVQHTRSVSQPLAQYPAVPHPPPTARFMHSTHPPHQLSRPPLRQPPMPQRPGHVQAPQAHFQPPQALNPGPAQQLPHSNPMQMARPQNPVQIAPVKTKKAKKTPKVSKKEQRQLALQQQQPHPQGVPLQPVQPKISKKEQKQLLKHMGAHPPIQPYHPPTGGPLQRPMKTSAIKLPPAQTPLGAPNPPKQAQAHPPRPLPQSAPTHGPSLDRAIQPTKPAKKPSLFSRMFGGSSHHHTPSPPPNPHAQASGAIGRPLPPSFSGPTGPGLAGHQPVPMPNRPPKPKGGSGPGHGFGSGWGHNHPSGHGSGHGPYHGPHHGANGPGHASHSPQAPGHGHGHSPIHGQDPHHSHSHTGSHPGNHPGSHHSSPNYSKPSLHSHATNNNHSPNGTGTDPNGNGPAQTTSIENPPSTSPVSPTEPGTGFSNIGPGTVGGPEPNEPGEQTNTTNTNVNANINGQQWPGYTPTSYPQGQNPTSPGLSDPQNTGVNNPPAPPPYPNGPSNGGFDPRYSNPNDPIHPGYSNATSTQPWNNTGTYDPSHPGDYDPPYNPGFAGNDPQSQSQPQTGTYVYNSGPSGSLDGSNPWQTQQAPYGSSPGPTPGQPGVYDPTAPGGTDRSITAQHQPGGFYHFANASPAGHTPSGQQPPGAYQATNVNPSGVGMGGLIAAGVGGAALGGLAAAGIMHEVHNGSDGQDETEGEDEDEDEDSDDGEDGGDDDTDEDGDDENSDDEDGSDDDEDEDDDEEDSGEDEDEDEDDEGGAEEGDDDDGDDEDEDNDEDNDENEDQDDDDDNDDDEDDEDDENEDDDDEDDDDEDDDDEDDDDEDDDDEDDDEDDEDEDEDDDGAYSYDEDDY
ncbi:hypothetical protein BJY00DRAFT_319044 [Aspergillus carlsbadensis]|nr:hypothetical protein BJY00DRAFT_319044 [Aspergillus carlsbadensis]